MGRIHDDPGPQSGAARVVEQCLLARLIGQIESVLHEVHAQHALESYRGTAVAAVGIVQLDDLAQLCPRDNLVHRGQEHITFSRAPVLLESSVFIGCDAKALLFQWYINAAASKVVDLLSVALTIGEGRVQKW